ncbi:MAG: YggS family pyridoxal phosphate-dependent enzyme [Chryseolinea sp.]
MNIKNNIQNIIQNLSPGCKLIAVSKNNPIEKIKEAHDSGQIRFGENKVQELVPKYEALSKDIEWHMIGHLQSNKVKFIAPFISLIHSIDSLKLLEEVNKQALKVNRIIPCLLQVHIAEEETKFGFSNDELKAAFDSTDFGRLNNVRIVGLMGMATTTSDTEQIKREFSGLKGIFDNLRSIRLPDHVSMVELSMGMSSDYSLAVACGSTMIRVGSAIFGERS